MSLKRVRKKFWLLEKVEKQSSGVMRLNSTIFPPLPPRAGVTQGLLGSPASRPHHETSAAACVVGVQKGDGFTSRNPDSGSSNKCLACFSGANCRHPGPSLSNNSGAWLTAKAIFFIQDQMFKIILKITLTWGALSLRLIHTAWTRMRYL